MKKIICRAALLLALCLPVCALAATEPNAKTIEDTTTYEGDTIKITIDQWCYAFNRTNLRFFVANVYVSDPAQMQTAFAGEQYSKNNAAATSAIAERDGTFIALPRGTYAAGDGQKYIDEGAVQSFTFGPLLVNDGEAVELPEKYIISTKDTIREPRTAIGQVDANHYVLVVADGRRDGWSDKGMTLQELQQVFVEQGCKVAYNLDGGGSATMILGSQRVNKTSGSRERDVSDIVYFTK